MPNGQTSNIILYLLGKPREREIHTEQMFLGLVHYFLLDTDMYGVIALVLKLPWNSFPWNM